MFGDFEWREGKDLEVDGNCLFRSTVRNEANIPTRDHPDNKQQC
jgi:hypothetical protein